MAWIFFNDFSIKLNKDANNNLTSGKNYWSCSYVKLIDTSLYQNFRYYNPLDISHTKFVLGNHLKYKWTANPALYVPLSNDTTPNILIDKYWTASPPNGKPPAVNTWFHLKVTDSYNLTKTDSLYYKTIQTRALFSPADSIKLFNRGDSISAPLTVMFKDSSVNARTYLWLFPGALPSDTATVSNPSERVYFEPNRYTVTFVTKSMVGCPDTFKINFEVAKASVGGHLTGTRWSMFSHRMVMAKTINLKFQAFPPMISKLLFFQEMGHTNISFDNINNANWEGY